MMQGKIMTRDHNPQLFLLFIVINALLWGLLILVGLMIWNHW